MSAPEKTSPALRHCRGFTLYEVLIAVSLLALLSLVTVSALRFGVGAWRKGDAALSAMEEVSFAQQFLRQSLSSAYPRLAGEGQQSVEFSGSDSEIRIVGPVPLSVSPAARANLMIRVEKTDRGENLIAEIRPELMDEDARDATVREMLIGGMKEIRFSYMAKGETAWRDRWANEPRLPALIRIEAAPAENREAVWPELIIAPQIDADASCRYDALSKYCQGRR
ncbi:MAG: prepilin-type N-terminal cleavage/methylation domain-containing protein [Parvularculaceae bacterium]